MRQHGRSVAAFILAVAVYKPAGAQTSTDLSRRSGDAAKADLIRLVVPEGTPVRVALDRKVRISGAGQEVTAIVVEPIYAYDRVVIRAGTKATGHIAEFVDASTSARAQRMLGGDFTPPRTALLTFDRLVPGEGPAIELRTRPAAGIANVTLSVAEASPDEPGVSKRAREEAARQLKDAIHMVTAPGKMERIKDGAIASLPMHPTYLAKGTVYVATLATPLDFGTTAPIAPAAPGTPLRAGSILNARLVTPLASSSSSRGDRVEAVLTRPVFAADGGLVLPAGTVLEGTVTFTRAARRFHRNGQLRFLFERVKAGDGAAAGLLASLYSVESPGADRVSVDEEGGVKTTGSAARFVAPAAAAVALAATLHGSVETPDGDSLGPETNYGVPGSNFVGGLIGFGAIGVALAQLPQPVTIAVTAYGLLRTTLSAVFGRGRNVVFPAGTSIQVRLAPPARDAR